MTPDQLIAIMLVIADLRIQNATLTSQVIELGQALQSKAEEIESLKEQLADSSEVSAV